MCRRRGPCFAPFNPCVVFIGLTTDPYLDRQALKISVFMNVFSVHSNRSPTKGVVKKIWYTPGRFINAVLDKASEQNERNAIWITDSQEKSDIVFVQVAGLIARRILCYVKEGDYLDWGQRYGFIRFGSRLDLYLPEKFAAQVKLGDKVTAGVDVVAVYSQYSGFVLWFLCNHPSDQGKIRIGCHGDIYCHVDGRARWPYCADDQHNQRFWR